MTGWDPVAPELAPGARELELPGAVLAVGADGGGGGAGAEEGGEDAGVGGVGDAGDGPGGDVGGLPVGRLGAGLGDAGEDVEAEGAALLRLGEVDEVADLVREGQAAPAGSRAGARGGWSRTPGGPRAAAGPWPRA